MKRRTRITVVAGIWAVLVAFFFFAPVIHADSTFTKLPNKPIVLYSTYKPLSCTTLGIGFTFVVSGTVHISNQTFYPTCNPGLPNPF